jgi:hypothetical protein
VAVVVHRDMLTAVDDGDGHDEDGLDGRRRRRVIYICNLTFLFIHILLNYFIFDTILPTCVPVQKKKITSYECEAGTPCGEYGFQNMLSGCKVFVRSLIYLC